MILKIDLPPELIYFNQFFKGRADGDDASSYPVSKTAKVSWEQLKAKNGGKSHTTRDKTLPFYFRSKIWTHSWFYTLLGDHGRGGS